MHSFRLRPLFYIPALLALSVATSSFAQNSAAPSDSSPAPNARSVYRAGMDGVSAPSCYYMPNPHYTKEARAAKLQGMVFAEGLVTLEGRITNVRILRSLGMGLDESVEKTLGKWKCKPAQRNGRAVPALVAFQFRFHLN